MDFAVGRQDDGSYVLRFEQKSIRTEIAITSSDFESMIMEMQMAASK